MSRETFLLMMRISFLWRDAVEEVTKEKYFCAMGFN
jgi:hypothetical protein